MNYWEDGDWIQEYVAKNTYWKKKRAFWFHRSVSGKLIQPFARAYIKVRRRPYIYGDDYIAWYTKEEFLLLAEDGQVPGLKK